MSSPGQVTPEAAQQVVAAVLRDSELPHEAMGDGAYVVQLPGEHRLKTTCWLTVSNHGLRVEAFVSRRPDENHERVYSFLLTRNATMFAVAWSIDDHGDIYLSGRLPLAAVVPEVLDQVLGAVLEYSDGTFDQILQLGFGTAIRKEWAWRTKNGESLANLAAFKDFIQRTASRDGQQQGDGGAGARPVAHADGGPAAS
jgi:hypothetical protein